MKNSFALSRSHKIYIFLFLLAVSIALLTPSITLAASGPVVKYFGGSNWEVFNSLDHTQDGGYVVVGHSSSNDRDMKGLNKRFSDAVIVKFSAGGDIEWVKTFGGGSTDSFQDVKQTKDGGYIAVGSSSSIDMDMANSRKRIREGEQEVSNIDAIIVKFNSGGDIEWFQDFGGSQRDIFNAVVETREGDFIVVGESSSADGDLFGLAQGDDDAILARYSRAGTYWRLITMVVHKAMVLMIWYCLTTAVWWRLAIAAVGIRIWRIQETVCLRGLWSSLMGI